MSGRHLLYTNVAIRAINHLLCLSLPEPVTRLELLGETDG